ncbi:MAG: hypothetical protein ACI9JT_000871 [Polaribacter sp.]|jgi:hypothetical protein
MFSKLEGFVAWEVLTSLIKLPFLTFNTRCFLLLLEGENVGM